MYEEHINNKSLLGFKESIDGMSDIFKINIIENLENKKDYYYLNHDLFELYVLDFNKIIASESLIYINRILQQNFTIMKTSNLSKNKSYYDKYIATKKMLGTKLDSIIEEQFNPFYFTAFKQSNNRMKNSEKNIYEKIKLIIIILLQRKLGTKLDSIIEEHNLIQTIQ